MTQHTLPPWTNVLAANWANAERSVYHADLSRCTPASALSGISRKKTWRVTPYETKAGMTGNLLWAFADADAPTVRLPLNVDGWHAIFVGLYETNHTRSRVWLKLDGDVAAVPREGMKPVDYWAMQEVFFKVAKLTKDQAINIGQMRSGSDPNRSAGIAYVRLISLSAQEASDFQMQQADRSRRRLVGMCDGFSFIHELRPTTPGELLAEIEMYRDTDFGALLLHIGGVDQVAFPTAVGSQPWAGIDTFPDAGYRAYSEAVAELNRKGINPTKVLIEGAHAMGMKVHVGSRPALWSYYPPFTDFFESRFYREHPEWRTIDRDGTPVARMSWAVPEVRAHVIEVLREAVSFGADGAHLVFNRGFPMTCYEPAFCAMFESQHGVDPRTIDESDPRILELRVEIVTTFMREMRAMLDAEARRRGSVRRLELSLCVLSNEFDNLQYGLDLRRLASLGLFDELYPNVHTHDFGATKMTWDMAFFMEICRPRGIRVFPMFSWGAVGHPEYWSREVMLQKSEEFYAQGAAGLAFWDMSVTNSYDSAPPELWTIASRLGHLEEIAPLKARGLPKAVFLPLKRVGETRLDTRFPPFWGG